MNFETYLTQTIQKAVKEAIREEFDELSDTIRRAVESRPRSVQLIESNTQSKIIRPRALAEMLSLSISTLYKMYGEGQLPPKVKISSRAVGWLRSDIEEWLISRKKDE